MHRLHLQKYQQQHYAYEHNCCGNKYLAEVNGISVGHLYKTNPSKLIEQVKTVANNKEVKDFAI